LSILSQKYQAFPAVVAFNQGLPAKSDRGLDIGFWEILKSLKCTNITSFFLIKTNG
jgi:hypothetical protein